MVDELNYQEHIYNAFNKIVNLPTGEMKYYLYILVNSIKEENIERNQLFLDELLSFIHTLEQLQKNKAANTDLQLSLLIVLSEQYVNLETIAETHTFAAKLKTIILTIGAIITATVCAVIGGILGSISGLFRGLWNLNPISGLFVGLFIGVCMGGMFGFRLPKKIFQNELQRQLKFGLNGLENSLNNFIEGSHFNNDEVKPFFQYRAEVERELQSQFNSPLEYKNFIEGDIVFEINTYYASFIGSPMLHTYLGHHAYIKIDIKGTEHLIEFSTTPSVTSDLSIQTESRTVKGEKLLEMLAYHRKLNETNPSTLPIILASLKPGDTDCFSYINKVLIGTSQKGTELQRFAQMNDVGSKIGFFLEKLSPFKPEFFTEERNIFSQ